MVEHIPQVYGFCSIHTTGGAWFLAGLMFVMGSVFGFFLFPAMRRIIDELDGKP